MLPSTLSSRYREEDEAALAFWVRVLLVGILGGLGVVFGIAWWLDPYQPDGTPRTMATHRQLGLPPCTFVDVTGIPCPACGMTTSFSLLVRGDMTNSLKANWVGTLLASFCLVLIPWAVASVIRGRALLVRSLEKALIGIITTLLVLMFTRWAVVVSLVWANRM